jgi:dTDP-4-dehydrorhamnose reductase
LTSILGKQKILVLGVSGMLGHTLFAKLCQCGLFEVRGTVRKLEPLARHFTPDLLANVQTGTDADNFHSVIEAVACFNPDQVINCIGIIKQLSTATQPISSITINALFPHRLASLCKASGARVIQISTDCVFDGMKGNYREEDPSNASDIYGRTKFLGELDYPHCITLRTSMIGHEVGTRHGLIEWFLTQQGPVRGFTRAIFSGLPTIELTRVIARHVIPNRHLRGLYHVSTTPLSKYDLLKMVAQTYGRQTEIAPWADFHADRSLDSSRFTQATGYVSPPWENLIRGMHQDFLTAEYYSKR